MTPPKAYPVRLSKAPRIRRVFWCDFPNDAHKPEFWKLRPVVVLSKAAKFHGLVTVVPLSTLPQQDNPMAVPIASPFDPTKTAWVVCDYLTTVATSRLTQDKSGVPLVGQGDFDQIVKRVMACLPDAKRASPKASP